MAAPGNQLRKRAGLPSLDAAVVHDWLTVYGGAERVLSQLLQILPQSDVYTPLNLLDKEEEAFLKGHDVYTSFLSRMPFTQRHYQKYMPLVPVAVEGFDLTKYSLVVSSSFLGAKGVLTTAEQLHVCYQHTPLRYAWDLQFEYLNKEGYNRGAKRLIARGLLHYMRLLDVSSANRVDAFIANSQTVSRRIWRVYRRLSDVIYPPVDTNSFTLDADKEDYYVTVSRLVPYKRVDLLVQTFNELKNKKLVVIGGGPQLNTLRQRACSNVKILGPQDESTLVHYLRHARAFLFAAWEDFGIAPVEAQACGTPVIAYGRGGALETVVPGVTGRFFSKQSVASLRAAIEDFEDERERYEPEVIRQHADRFSMDRFQERTTELLERAWEQFATEGRIKAPLLG